MSFNNITVLTNIEKMRNLTEIWTQGILLGRTAPLSSLGIQHADRTTITGVKTSLLTAFNLGNNPSYCNCDAQNTAIYFQSTLTEIVGWPEEYMCAVSQSERWSTVFRILALGTV